VAGFEFPDSGTLRLEGEPIIGPGADRGVVFQGDDSLFEWLRVLDNISFGPRMHGVSREERRRIGLKYLEMMGLSGQGQKRPSQLSGGMKQRVQIARVLANDPKVLLMDEPFAAVDAQTRSGLQEELVRIWEKTHKTILFITHDITEAILLADRIGVMRAGPGSAIRQIFAVSLPRPRSRAAQAFGELYEDINAIIREEVDRSRLSFLSAPS
jgi:NitT/TauT family transport system ATP-binding protein